MQLIVRSHEGPDARDKRPEMQAMNTATQLIM